MKTFLVNTSKFVLFFLLVIIAVYSLSAGLTIIISNYGKTFELPSEKKVLIAGDSHTQYAINDSIFNEALNVSLSSEVFLYNYIKIRKLTEKNSSIKTVLLAYSYHNIMNSIDSVWFYGDDVISIRFSGYYYLMNLNEIKEIYFANTKSFWEALSKIPLNTLSLISSLLQKNIKAIKGFEGYEPLYRDKLAEDTLQINRIGVIDEWYYNYSLIQLKYLFKIISYCKEKNIKLILINTPLHKKYFWRYPLRVQKYKNFTQKYLSDITLLDFSNMQMPDSCFSDTEHLNAKGAAIFSNYLRNIIISKINL